MKKQNKNIITGLSRYKLAAMETERLCRKYGKEYLDCGDLKAILGIGRDNARALMRSDGFPHCSHR